MSILFSVKNINEEINTLLNYIKLSMSQILNAQKFPKQRVI